MSGHPQFFRDIVIIVGIYGEMSITIKERITNNIASSDQLGFRKLIVNPASNNTINKTIFLEIFIVYSILNNYRTFLTMR